MTSKFDNGSLTGKPASTRGDDKSKTKAADLERLRKSLAKRSLDVKFDLQDTDYKPIENIGIGAYGVVCSAIQKKSGDRVAIKKIPSVFEALTIAKRTYREIKILKHFKHDNIICIREILLPKENAKDFKDIYVVFDLMESDLHRIIYSEQELSEEHIRYFLYQILRGLKYIHSANVIHRDLKPSNLLVNEDCHLRIGDFGMARGVFYTPNEPSYYMTQYVATRWYRAPEILLSMLEYGTAVDMWSVGCIFAEMIGRKHLFPGKDYITQVKLILGVLGTPSDALLKNCQNDILKRIIKGFTKKEPVSWDKLFPKTSKKSLDLLSKMLVLNPTDRITVERALSHRLLNNYHDPDDEPICVPTFNFDFEKEDLDKNQLRSAIMDEIMSFHQPKAPTLSFSACLRPAPKPEDHGNKEGKLEDDPSVGGSAQPPPNSGEIKANKTEHGLVFKAPSSVDFKPSNKVSPVSVDIGKLHVGTACADIEMLSAQSNDGRPMDTHQADLLSMNKVISEDEEKDDPDRKAAGDKDLKGGQGDKKGGNTISEDTKARVKLALMNATQRKQRAESQGEETKDTRPVTAAQRQKEREEKRRKKKERALEKVKKSKEKKAGGQDQSITLSSQDMELLRRWTVMQNPGQGGQQADATSPPHPGPAVTPPQVTSLFSNIDISSETGGGQQNLPGAKPRQILAKTTAATSVTLGTSVNIASNHINSGGTVLMPTTQLNIVQTNFIPVLAIPSTLNPGKMEFKRIYPHVDMGQHQVIPSSAGAIHAASDSTKNLLQNAILMRTQNSGLGLTLQTLKSQSDASIKQNAAPQTHNFTSSPQPNIDFSADVKNILTDSPVAQSTILASSQFTNSSLIDPHLLHSDSGGLFKEDKLSPRSQGNDLYDFLDEHLKDSPKPDISSTPSQRPEYHNPTQFSQTSTIPEQNSHFVIGAPLDSPQHSISSPPPAQQAFSSYNPTHEDQLTRSNSTPSLLRRHTHSPSNPDPVQLRSQRSSLPFAAYNTQQSFSSSFPNQSNFPLNFQHSDDKFPEKFSQSIDSTNFPVSFCEQDSVSSFPQTPTMLNYGSQIHHPNMIFQNTTDFPPHSDHLQHNHHHHHHHQQQQRGQHLHSQIYGSGSSYGSLQNFQNLGATASPPSMSFGQNFPGFHPQQTDYPQDISHFQSDSFTRGQAHQQVQEQNLIRNQPMAMSQNSVPMSSLSSGTFDTFAAREGGRLASGLSVTGSTNTGHKLRINCSHPPRGTDAHADLIALISKQLSRSQVSAIFPPALALTPKGTGAGYGVGMDLDNMLTDAQDNASMRPEQSPLSSSLLADWLDISGNISQADLEALEREINQQSPMHVSYGDMNI